MYTILVTASAMPTALKIKPMPNADGIEQTALAGIENAYFSGFQAKIHQKSYRNSHAHHVISFMDILYPPKLYQIVKFIDYFLLYEIIANNM